MFDPRDISSDPRRRTPEKPKRDHLKERQERKRTGSRAEFDPRSDRADFTGRTERAVAEIGMYRTVAYKDLSEAHFDGHPYTTRRAVDRMIQQGDVQEHTGKGPQGGTYKVLTLTEKGVHRAEVAAQDQGLDSGQKAWSGMVKSAELQHDTAAFRAARVEQGKLIEKGAVLKRVRIDAELKREVARASETARMKGGKEAADEARVEKAAELGLPVKAGKVEYPDAQLEYDLDGRSGRVNVEIATEHYSTKSIGAKAAAGFAVHGSNGRAKARAKGQGEDSAEKKAQESRQWPGDTITGRPRYLPPLYELIEGGKVLALNMPAGSNPALARAIGVMLKNAWLQALLMRPAQMKESPSTYFRPAVFICDEYQSFASVGEDDPTGDEKSFALTRQCRCIPIVATQSISSLRAVLGSSEAWRALLQTLRTRIFLSLSDDASAKIASELCGQVAKIKGSYTISETSKRAEVSPLSGRGGGGAGSIGATKSFQERREAVFHPRDFALLGNCQAICLPYDGAQSLEPRRVYLKPHYLPLDHSYWRAKEAGQI